MNFKRYHVSKNLFDEQWIQGIYNTINGTYTDASNRICCKNRIEVSPSISYSVTNTITQFRVLYYDINDDFISYNGNNTTFTTPSNCKYIRFFLAENHDVSDAPQLMLNTGSQPLPYEPYSSEVWHDIPHYIMGTSTDTITTLPADIYANDTTATVGLKGDMQQSGTPTPTTPIQPSECGERTGNLFEVTDSSATADTIVTLVDFGADVTFDTITCSCVFDNLEAEITSGAFIDYRMDNGTHQYVALSGMSNVNDNTGVPANVKVNGNYYNTKQNITFRRIQAYLSTTGYNKFKSGSIKWAFYDSAKKDYVPYGYKIPISSAGQTTPVYLGEVETTRNIMKLVLNGTENWLVESGTNGLFTLPNVISLIQYNNQLCTHFSLASSYVNFYNTDLTFAVVTRPCILIHYNACQTVSAFKAFLASEYAAGHPVTIWYVLATPQTAVVNEPIRKIGDYADEVSGITIPTIAGANTISVDTTLQPSEVSVNYHGWHPVLAVHERENGAWD